MKLVLNGVSLLTYLSANGNNSTDHAKFLEGTLVVLEDGTLCFGRGYLAATDTSLHRFSVYLATASGLTVVSSSHERAYCEKTRCSWCPCTSPGMRWRSDDHNSYFGKRQTAFVRVRFFDPEYLTVSKGHLLGLEK
jgi:hypothetical protein